MDDSSVRASALSSSALVIAFNGWPFFLDGSTPPDGTEPNVTEKQGRMSSRSRGRRQLNKYVYKKTWMA